MDREVLVERKGQTLLVTINRPAARNAINRAAALAIAAAMDEIDNDPALVIGIITGAGGHFSAGMDLKAFLRGEPREVEGRGFAGITDAPPRKPLIAAVEGAALAGGCEIALACDLIVAADDAVFGLPEVKRGLVAGSGGLLRLPQRLPRQIALEYLFTGKPLPAVEAKRWGMINRLTKPGEALAQALDLATEIAVNAPLALTMTKRIVTESALWPPAEVWHRQRRLVEEVLASEDAKEGARAFAERRAPRWQGK
jgi:enoyl-CoA hydratase